MKQNGSNSIGRSVFLMLVSKISQKPQQLDLIRWPNVVRPTQTAFMQGRNILDGVVILHEMVHEMHRKKLNGVILKIDFEKAYDKVKWSFLQQILRMKGFSDEWRAMIHNFISVGSVAIKVNDDVGRYFQTRKGLRQGDPLSPILFNIS